MKAVRILSKLRIFGLALLVVVLSTCWAHAQSLASGEFKLDPLGGGGPITRGLHLFRPVRKSACRGDRAGAVQGRTSRDAPRPLRLPEHHITSQRAELGARG